MKEIEFDLLTEPWIRVRLKDNTVQDVSLTEALVSAQDYVDLCNNGFFSVHADLLFGYQLR